MLHILMKRGAGRDDSVENGDTTGGDQHASMVKLILMSMPLLPLLSMLMTMMRTRWHESVVH